MIKRIKMDSAFYPVEAFFNRLNHDDFIMALENFSNGRGYNPEDMTCFFPCEMVEDEGGEIHDYKYIAFWEYSSNSEVFLDFSDFMSILKKAVESEIKINAGAEEKINQLVLKISQYLLKI